MKKLNEAQGERSDRARERIYLIYIYLYNIVRYKHVPQRINSIYLFIICWLLVCLCVVYNKALAIAYL